MARRCMLLAILFFSAPLFAALFAAAPAPEAASAQTQAAPRRAASAEAQPATAPALPPALPADDDLASLRTYLHRMQSLLDQLERNLAMVGSGVTPLRHQFELEIEMWRVLTQQMEGKVRRLQLQQKSKN